MAYRFPFSNEVFCYEGNLLKESSSKKHFIIQPFSGPSQKIGKLNPITLEDFPASSLVEDIPYIDSKASYLERFEVFHSSLREKKHEKLILSRVKEMANKDSATKIFQKLNNTYSNTFNYLLISPEFGTWMGATPEKLGIVKKGIFETVAIAATKLANERRDWTEKETHEHQLVVNFIQEGLENKGLDKIRIGERGEIKAGNVLHLKTEITAQIKGNGEEIINALHPTSATCGLPQKSAQEFILKNEAHSRELYTGYIGIIDEEKSDYYVNLRCMKMINQKSYLFLGGGLTVASVGESEWEETENKGKTLGNIIG